jgi:hypothetical protein
MPMIKHSFITRSIEEMENLRNKSETGIVDRKDFNKTMDFFKTMRFYLRSEECEKINKLRKEIEENDTDTKSIKIIWPELHPNPEMNDSYYIDES